MNYFGLCETLLYYLLAVQSRYEEGQTCYRYNIILYIMMQKFDYDFEDLLLKTTAKDYK